MRKQKLCVIWIWYLLYDNARFQRWLARHRRHGWELADVGCIFFRFERGDGTRYRYYMQMMRGDPDTKRGRTYLAGCGRAGCDLPGMLLASCVLPLEGRRQTGGNVFRPRVAGIGGEVRAQRAAGRGGVVRGQCRAAVFRGVA